MKDNFGYYVIACLLARMDGNKKKISRSCLATFNSREMLAIISKESGIVQAVNNLLRNSESSDTLYGKDYGC